MEFNKLSFNHNVYSFNWRQLERYHELNLSDEMKDLISSDDELHHLISDLGYKKINL